MTLRTRKILSFATTATGIFAFCLMGGAILVILVPLAFKGSQAFIFQDTVERREFRLDNAGFNCDNPEKVRRQLQKAQEARKPVYKYLQQCEESLGPADITKRRKLNELKQLLRPILGPLPGDEKQVSPHKKYGASRWEQCRKKVHELLYRTEYKYPEGGGYGKPVDVPRKKNYQEYPELAKIFDYFSKSDNVRAMMQPGWTFYWRFLVENATSSHFFGGIRSALIGTFYLGFGAMIIAGPLGVISAVYLTQYARGGRVIGLLRTCISTLAGVPSVVFGLFGLGFFIYQLQISDGRSVFVGALTLALLILPTVIRASEEALLSVPRSYREASEALGDTKWGSIVKVILPAALPGIVTSFIISMGRAAGETAPILFTAAVISSGSAVGLTDIFSSPTQALPSSIYLIISEHRAADQIMHVPYGMVFTLVGLVICLNLIGIVMRARVSKKLQGQ